MNKVRIENSNTGDFITWQLSGTWTARDFRKYLAAHSIERDFDYDPVNLFFVVEGVNPAESGYKIENELLAKLLKEHNIENISDVDDKFMLEVNYLEGALQISAEAAMVFFEEFVRMGYAMMADFERFYIGKESESWETLVENFDANNGNRGWHIERAETEFEGFEDFILNGTQSYLIEGFWFARPTA